MSSEEKVASSIEWLRAVLENMKADETYEGVDNDDIILSADYFINELERLTTDGKHPFDCKCAIHR